MTVKKDSKPAPPSKENAEFIPARGWFGNEHKEKGVYFYENGEIIFYKCEGYKGRSIKFDVKSVSSLAHVRKFTFLFLVIFYSFQFINSIAFLNKEGKVLGMLALRSFSKKNLRKVLQKINDMNKDISMDPAVTQYTESGKRGKINMNFFKAIIKGFIPWVIIAIVAFFVLVATS
jgi:hypothetical protein